MEIEDSMIRREQVRVAGTDLSYLAAGDPSAPPLLLLHGTFWSRVWQPVLPQLATARACVALDLPGFGRSEGELDAGTATVPALAAVVLEAADLLGWETFDLAGHDIGGGIAQHIAAHSGRVDKLILMNSVMFDSWPVPAVARFRDPQLRAITSPEELLQARMKTMQLTVDRELSDEEIADYTSPWRSPARCRSWMAMAAAADAHYTLDLVPALRTAALPTRLIWGRDDEFQKIEYAHRYVREIPGSDLVEVTGKHIPTEDSPDAVATAMLEHLAS
ncbi:oxidoreductase [Zafaria cholistanensis]|uniref:Oxidoreductase n=1 Tax=Zafaria cholistanensis TaxID=1682741 RepID=A0A5A7NSY0_9MICC|nr:alpha/beta hydrolase [Zafaria cholistanensis]GER23970.1 oxidoreductase [Zafaria cholistanensis]